MSETLIQQKYNAVQDKLSEARAATSISETAKLMKEYRQMVAEFKAFQRTCH